MICINDDCHNAVKNEDYVMCPECRKRAQNAAMNHRRIERGFAATLAARKSKPKLRRCLGIIDNGEWCKVEFVSNGPWHRFCKGCADKRGDFGSTHKIHIGEV